MKKVININFQGRVLPIEEPAYNTLKQYIETLERYFNKEEGKDEIINDIESRIGELFEKALQKGAPCITDAEVESIIHSIGRPEDFEEEIPTALGIAGENAQKNSSSQNNASQKEPRRLCRNTYDKQFGGVCAGIANYFRIDPVIVRILFVLVTLGGYGAGVLLYIILWISLPDEESAEPLSFGKRLYRNPDDKMIAGVASGIAAYFNISTWVPRLIFLSPLILGIIPTFFRVLTFHHFGFNLMSGSFGGTLFLIYLVLWIVLPLANSSIEKMEMRGEKVDINSIKNAVEEVRSTVTEKTKAFSNEVASSARSIGLGHAIGVLFKAFILGIAGFIAIMMFIAFIALFFAGIKIFPAFDFFFDTAWQKTLFPVALAFFLIVPAISLITWLIRRMTGVKKHNSYLSYIFSGLWLIGLVALVILFTTFTNNYTQENKVKDPISIIQPQHGKLFLKIDDEQFFYNNNWLNINWNSDNDDDNDNAPFYSISKDSTLLRMAQLRFIKSEDDNFHVNILKSSRGKIPDIARVSANAISYEILQKDSLLILPQGFFITTKTKFRNQQVMIVIEVPVGKKIQFDKSFEDNKWIKIIDEPVNRNRRFNMRWNEYGRGEDPQLNIEYVMSADRGLQTEKNKTEEIDNHEE